MKRYQVFVSSTFVDLQNERLAVLNALQRMDCFAAGMELFPSASMDQFEYIKRIIDQSDYYVLILAGRYGSIPKPETKPEKLSRIKSYTEMEFDYAQAQGKFILPFLHYKPDELPGKFCEDDKQKRSLLDEFREKVQVNRLVSFYSSPEELAGKVISSLHHAMSIAPRPGWVRASASALPQSGDVVKQLNLQNQENTALKVKVMELEDQLDIATRKNLHMVSTRSISQPEDSELGLFHFVEKDGSRELEVTDQEHKMMYDEYKSQADDEAYMVSCTAYWYDDTAGAYNHVYEMRGLANGNIPHLTNYAVVIEERLRTYMSFLIGLAKDILALSGHKYFAISNLVLLMNPIVDEVSKVVTAIEKHRISKDLAQLEEFEGVYRDFLDVMAQVSLNSVPENELSNN